MRVSFENLIEMSSDDIVEAEKRLTDDVEVIAVTEINCFDVFRVRSGDRTYRVVRLGNFALCECDQFKFRRAACKHVAATFPKLCYDCRERQVSRRGERCQRCSEKIYLKPASTTPIEKFGRFRI